ncbi:MULTISPECIES: SDR family oxidoreductase [Bradyrhizobium]|uniref:SDR family oxidoreductase n=1 Tax=Bradyrhizobium elkanii TaxID=29448 RepID=A0A4U6S926_BRAEL|nr:MULTISPECIES: SDR family oxidoreductase [Bradyrhizobium]TKV83758.1 SDR family oxidoreductase [Bradyrhizobium elkanii]
MSEISQEAKQDAKPERHVRPLSAAYAVFFMSDESVYVTARTLAVDSGPSGL